MGYVDMGYDGPILEFSRENVVRVRKPRICAYCNCKINVGKKAHVQVQKTSEDDKPYTVYSHYDDSVCDAVSGGFGHAVYLNSCDQPVIIRVGQVDGTPCVTSGRRTLYGSHVVERFVKLVKLRDYNHVLNKYGIKISLPVGKEDYFVSAEGKTTGNKELVRLAISLSVGEIPYEIFKDATEDYLP